MVLKKTLMSTENNRCCLQCVERAFSIVHLVLEVARVSLAIALHSRFENSYFTTNLRTTKINIPGNVSIFKN